MTIRRRARIGVAAFDERWKPQFNIGCQERKTIGDRLRATSRRVRVVRAATNPATPTKSPLEAGFLNACCLVET
jgi:hypothetical protein